MHVAEITSSPLVSVSPATSLVLERVANELLERIQS